MADQVLKMMKDEQEKKELLFLKQLEFLNNIIIL